MFALVARAKERCRTVHRDSGYCRTIQIRRQTVHCSCSASRNPFREALTSAPTAANEPFSDGATEMAAR